VASGTHWALGIQARAEALSMKDQAAEDRYREAIERLGALPRGNPSRSGPSRLR